MKFIIVPLFTLLISCKSDKNHLLEKVNKQYYFPAIAHEDLSICLSGLDTITPAQIDSLNKGVLLIRPGSAPFPFSHMLNF